MGFQFKFGLTNKKKMSKFDNTTKWKSHEYSNEIFVFYNTARGILRFYVTGMYII